MDRLIRIEQADRSAVDRIAERSNTNKLVTQAVITGVAGIGSTWPRRAAFFVAPFLVQEAASAGARKGAANQR